MSQPEKNKKQLRYTYLKKKRQSNNETWSVNRRNMRNIFLEKSYIKRGGRTMPRPFSKISKLSISLDQHLYSLFLLYAKLRVIEIY